MQYCFQIQLSIEKYNFIFFTPEDSKDILKNSP